MAVGNTIIKFDTDTDIKTAIQFVIDLVRDARENYDLVYNEWFKNDRDPGNNFATWVKFVLFQCYVTKKFGNVVNNIKTIWGIKCSN